jgi:hypothetical protein
MRNWTEAGLEQLKVMAIRGMAATDIAAALGCSRLSVLTMASKHGVMVTKYNEAERAVKREKQRALDKKKNRRRRDKSKPQAELVAQSTKTSAIYRNQLPQIGNLSKTALRAMLHAAVLNTPGARV